MVCFLIVTGEITEHFLLESCFLAALKIFLKNFAFWVRVFSIFCTYISERVFITVPNKPERGFKRYVRYRKTGRTRQASGAGKHPPEAAARGNKPLRFLPDVIHGTCRGGGRTYSAGTDRRVGRVRRDAAAGGRGRLCAGGRRLLCRSGSDHRAVLPAQKQRKSEKDGTDKPNQHKQEGKTT